MSRQIHLHDEPDRCVVGTVGEPGQRVFFIQVRSGRRVNCVALEKEQVQILAERIESLLDEMVARGEIPADEVDDRPPDDEPLETPIEEDFRVGSLGLGWNSNTDQLIVEAHATTEEEAEVPDLETDAEGPDTLRVRLSSIAGRAFAARAQAVVSAGRPPCPFCHLPLDPRGHICPRANGYRR